METFTNFNQPIFFENYTKAIEYFKNGLDTAEKEQKRVDKIAFFRRFPNAFKQQNTKQFFIYRTFEFLYKNVDEIFWRASKRMAIPFNNKVYKGNEIVTNDDVINSIIYHCLEDFNVELRQQKDYRINQLDLVSNITFDELWVGRLVNEILSPQDRFSAKDIIIQKPQIQYSIDLYNKIPGITNEPLGVLKSRLQSLNTLQQTNSFIDNVLEPARIDLENKISFLNQQQQQEQPLSMFSSLLNLQTRPQRQSVTSLGYTISNEEEEPLLLRPNRLLARKTISSYRPTPYPIPKNTQVINLLDEDEDVTDDDDQVSLY